MKEATPEEIKHSGDNLSNSTIKDDIDHIVHEIKLPSTMAKDRDFDKIRKESYKKFAQDLRVKIEGKNGFINYNPHWIYTKSKKG